MARPGNTSPERVAPPRALLARISPRAFLAERSHRVGAFTAIVAFLLCIALDVATTSPAWTAPLQLQIRLPVGVPGRSEPLAATGYVGRADLLTITYQHERAARIVYQSGNYGFATPEFTYEPDHDYPLTLTLPAITHAGTRQAAVATPLKVTLAGVSLLETTAPFHPTSRSRLFLGENPVAGATFGTLFRGELRTVEGERIRGNARQLAPVPMRIRTWLADHAWHFLPAALVAGAAGWAGSRFWRKLSESPSGSGAAHLHFVAAVAINLIAFAWLMTSGSFQLIYPDASGAFYDFQTRSFLRGRLDVPREILGSEAFVIDGKAYGYFGPTPALLRLPFALLNVGEGHLTRIFMIAEYLAALLAAYFTLWHVTRVVRGPAVAPSRWAVLLISGATGLGSSFLFLGSRAYVYHEAILCGAACALWCGYFTLRYLTAPSTRHWIAAIFFAVLALHARPPAGLFAFAMLGFAALVQLVLAIRTARPWRRDLLLGSSAVIGFLTLPAMSYLKFRTFDGAPLKYHVQYDAKRLAKLEGRNFHQANLRHNLDEYFLRSAFESGRRFPFFAFELQRPPYPDAKIDLEEWTVSVVYVMSGLVFLSLASVATAIASTQARAALLVVALACCPLLLCMLTFIATSHRYTADFIPPLVVFACFGLATIDGQRRLPRALLLTAGTLASGFAGVLTLALSFHFRVELTWGVTEEVREHFVQTRATVHRWIGVTPP